MSSSPSRGLRKMLFLNSDKSLTIIESIVRLCVKNIVTHGATDFEVSTGGPKRPGQSYRSKNLAGGRIGFLGIYNTESIQYTCTMSLLVAAGGGGAAVAAVTRWSPLAAHVSSSSSSSSATASLPSSLRPSSNQCLDMEKPRILDDFDSDEMREFLDSFDTIIADCDGVLWLGQTPIEGSYETLKRLQDMGKKIVFVSNNSAMGVDYLAKKFKTMGYDVSRNQMAVPSMVICWYLKRRGFDGKAFVLGTENFRQALKAEGIDVGEPGPNFLEERIDAVVTFVRNAPEVDAVIVDFDINLNWAKMTRAISYLKNRETLFLTGALDRKIPISERMSFLGIPDFVDTMSKESNRKPIECAKPSEAMRDYVIETFGIEDPGRCIFVGDSLESDMKFADLCGFSKLWVGSGVHKLDGTTARQILTADTESSLPFYYLPRLGVLNSLIDKIKSRDDEC